MSAAAEESSFVLGRESRDPAWSLWFLDGDSVLGSQKRKRKQSFPGAGLQGSHGVCPRAAWGREHSSPRVPLGITAQALALLEGRPASIFCVICGIWFEPPEASPWDVLPCHGQRDSEQREPLPPEPRLL